MFARSPPHKFDQGMALRLTTKSALFGNANQAYEHSLVNSRNTAIGILKQLDSGSSLDRLFLCQIFFKNQYLH